VTTVIGCLPTQALAFLALHAMRALRKRKTQETQALALATMIGCFDRTFLLLAGACVRCVKIESVLSLRDLRLRTFVFLLAEFYCVSCALFILLAYFFLRKTLRALRVFEWKSGFSPINVLLTDA